MSAECTSLEQSSLGAEFIIPTSHAEALGILALSDGRYRAAYPGYEGNFSRDGFIYGLLADDLGALRAQLAFSALHQGTEVDGFRGREKGKIHHEMPGVLNNGRNTEFNACDTTALFLSTAAQLVEAGQSDVTDVYRQNIAASIEYIKAHLYNGLFYEDPAKSETDRFGLCVTSWKDSVLNTHYQEPRYPIVYSVAHFQNAEALITIGKAIGAPDLVEQGIEMTQVGMSRLWAGDHFVTAIDGVGEEEHIIDPYSSDSLYALLYINPELLPNGYAEKIQEQMQALESPAGYRTGAPFSPAGDEYHTRYIWVHEQALLHMAAVKHNLPHAAKVAARVVDFFDGAYPELIDPQQNYKPAGNRYQLWSIGTKMYFDRQQDNFMVGPAGLEPATNRL